MILTYSQLNKMLPVNHQTVTPHQLPIVDGNVMEWSNNDDEFVASLDMNTKELTGEYYQFDEAKEDWVDGATMTDEDLTTRLDAGEFLAVQAA